MGGVVAEPIWHPVRKRPTPCATGGRPPGVTLDSDACYRALRARDGRFDGVFFVGVTTTGVYCRPSARRGRRARSLCVLRQRRRGRARGLPGVLPLPAGDRARAGRRRLRAAARRRAVARIDAGALNEGSIRRAGPSRSVTSRHLRRALAEGARPSVRGAGADAPPRSGRGLHDTALLARRRPFRGRFGSVRRLHGNVHRVAPAPRSVGQARPRPRGAGRVRCAAARVPSTARRLRAARLPAGARDPRRGGD